MTRAARGRVDSRREPWILHAAPYTIEGDSRAADGLHERVLCLSAGLRWAIDRHVNTRSGAVTENTQSARLRRAIDRPQAARPGGRT